MQAVKAGRPYICHLLVSRVQIFPFPPTWSSTQTVKGESRLLVIIERSEMQVQLLSAPINMAYYSSLAEEACSRGRSTVLSLRHVRAGRVHNRRGSNPLCAIHLVPPFSGVVLHIIAKEVTLSPLANVDKLPQPRVNLTATYLPIYHGKTLRLYVAGSFYFCRKML